MTDPTVVAPETPTAPETAPAPETPSAIRSRVVREMFGKEFYEPEAKPEEIEEAKPVDTEAGEEAPPVEEPTEGEQPEEGEGTAPAEETGETPIASWSELVEHNPWVNSLKVPVTVDGTPTEATISDLVKSYQITTAAEHRLEDAKAIARKESEAWAAKHAAYDLKLHELGALVQYEEQKLDAEIRAVDPKLRDEDPAEWSARQTEFGQRRAQIEQVKARGRAEYEANQTAKVAEARMLRDQVTAEQAQLLLRAIPEWQDDQKASVEKTQIAQYALQSGYTEQDLSNLLDHRYVVTLRKAMLYDQSRGQVDAAKKRVAQVPKIMRPGAPKAREQLASERLATLEAKMKKSGKIEDALAYRLAKRGAR